MQLIQNSVKEVWHTTQPLELRQIDDDYNNINTFTAIVDLSRFNNSCLTHCGRVTQICVFTFQPCRTGDANLRF